VEVTEKALVELAADFWVIRQGPIVWLRNALRHDPSMRLSDAKHRKTIERWVLGLPKLSIVLTFCDYYQITRPFEDPSKRPRGPSPQEKEYEKESEKDPESEKHQEKEPRQGGGGDRGGGTYRQEQPPQRL
jgi:hypothetical protein